MVKEAYESYLLNVAQLDDADDLDDMIAMEADTNAPDIIHEDGEKTNTQSADKSEVDVNSKLKKFSVIAEGFIKNINNTLENFIAKYTTSMALLMQTDKGFIKEYYAAKKNKKPIKGSEFILYSYDDNFLNNAHKMFNAIVKEAANGFNTFTFGSRMPEDSIFEIPAKDFDRKMLDILKTPSDLKTFEDYYRFLRDRYRGTKKTVIIRPDSLGTYEKIATQNAKGLQALLNSEKAQAYAIIAKLSSKLKIVSHNKGLSDADRAASKEYAKRLVRIETAYNSFLDVYYKLSIEEIMTAREIVKTMYQL